jgi:hypothetical protein
MSILLEQIVKGVEQLPEADRQRVLGYIEGLQAKNRRGVPGAWLLEFAGAFDPEDLDRMEQAIEADCERIDPDEW